MHMTDCFRDLVAQAQTGNQGQHTRSQARSSLTRLRTESSNMPEETSTARKCAAYTPVGLDHRVRGDNMATPHDVFCQMDLSLVC